MGESLRVLSGRNGEGEIKKFREIFELLLEMFDVGV
jgi:hypothetical protein